MSVRERTKLGGLAPSANPLSSHLVGDSTMTFPCDHPHESVSSAEDQKTGEPSPAPWTVVISDIHLCDAEPTDPARPLWKRFKAPELFIDESLARLIDELCADATGPMELVFGGDTFDFQTVMAMPPEPEFPISWLERRRGLDSSEEKSAFKMEVILDTHPVFVESVTKFLSAGHRVVFVMGNHDIELHWPAVQRILRERLGGIYDDDRLRFCEWFYISNGDTLIEHGNQYDAYCLCSDPVWPLIKKRGELYVRTPFGNLAGKLMLNGMGLFNPNVESSFIMSTAEYVRFFFTYIARVQPLLPFTWFWTAMTTLVVSLREGLLPAQADPVRLEARIQDIARRANAQPSMVWASRAAHVHPAIYNPIAILRELWLDRAVLLLVILWLSAQAFAFVNVITPIRLWWILVPIAALLPLLVFYARSVESNVGQTAKAALENSGRSCQIAGVRRLIFGHTHRELHTRTESAEVINTGTWSPAYLDLECTKPMGKKTFASVRPLPQGGGRKSELFEWKDPGLEVIAPRSLASLEPKGAVEAIRATTVSD